MQRRFAAFLFGLLLTPLMVVAGHAERLVTDQLGRKVTLPDSVSRAVILQHQTLNLAVQMNTTGKIVGILDQWKQPCPAPAERTGLNVSGQLAWAPARAS